MVSSRFYRQVKYTYGLVKNIGRCCRLQGNNRVVPIPGERSELE